MKRELWWGRVLEGWVLKEGSGGSGVGNCGESPGWRLVRGQGHGVGMLVEDGTLGG